MSDFDAWGESDFECLDAIVNKIDLIHGRKKPSIVENVDKLEEYIEKIPTNVYNFKRSELDTFFKTFKPSNSYKRPKINIINHKSVITRVGALIETVDLAPGTSLSVILRLLGPVQKELLVGNFVRVGKNSAYQTPCELNPGISRVWVGINNDLLVRVTLVNKLTTSSTTVLKHTEIGLITWSR